MGETDNMHSDRAGDTSQRCGNAPAFLLPEDFVDPSGAPIPLSYAEQANRLSRKGFSGDVEVTEFLLKRVSYRTMIQYCLMVNEQDEAVKCIKNAHILLDFDRSIQSLFMKWIGIFELQFRSQYANAMASECGPFSHRHQGNFVNNDYFSDFLSDYGRELSYKIANKDVSSACEEYGDLPIWQAVDILPFGTLSKMYRNTRSKAVRFAVSDSFGVEYGILSSWMRTISEIRNRCAHFSSLVCKPIVCKPKKLVGVDVDNGGIFFFAIVLKVLTGCERRYADIRGLYDAEFIEDLEDIASKHDSKVLEIAGFPADFRDVLEQAATTSLAS